MLRFSWCGSTLLFIQVLAETVSVLLHEKHEFHDRLSLDEKTNCSFWLIRRFRTATRASHAKGYKLPKKWVQQIECLIYEIQIPLTRLLSELS